MLRSFRLPFSLRRLLLLAPLAALLWTGCAKQGYPSGGPKDTAPPVSTGSKPPSETRNFDRRQFYIAFDEYVVLKDANNNVLISPPLKHKADFSVKGKGVQVSLTDTLLPNTTYLFQFKEAIADFNEGNVLPSFEYVFSTGNDMDSLMLAGRVLNARDGKPWKEQVSVVAYRDRDTLADTMAAHLQPDFVTRCDKDGFFAFHYIPAGSYRLAALEDHDRNLRIGRSEAAAWEPTPVLALDSLDSNRMVLMRISSPDRRQQRVLKAEFSGRGHAVVATHLPMQNPSLEGDSLVWRLNPKRDTLSVWFLDTQRDSALLVLRDSALNDTLKLRYRPPSRRRQRGSSAQPQAEPLMKALCEGDKAFYDDLRIAFSSPVTAARDTLEAEVMLLEDSSLTHCRIDLDSSGLQARLMATLQSGTHYRIRLATGLFSDIYGNPSDSLEFKLSPRDYGILRIQVANLTHQPLVVELLDEKDTVVATKSLAGSGEVQFSHLRAAEYRLRAVVDSDGNGSWTTGDYFSGRQPEAVVYYEKNLQVREKWEMEERWTVKHPAPANQSQP